MVPFPEDLAPYRDLEMNTLWMMKFIANERQTSVEQVMHDILEPVLKDYLLAKEGRKLMDGYGERLNIRPIMMLKYVAAGLNESFVRVAAVLVTEAYNKEKAAAEKRQWERQEDRRKKDWVDF